MPPVDGKATRDRMTIRRLFEYLNGADRLIAPGLFSTTIRQPSLWPSSLATMRLMMSGGVPAAAATTMRIMFDG